VYNCLVHAVIITLKFRLVEWYKVKLWGRETETLIPPRRILILVKGFPNKLFCPENLAETMCESAL